MGLLDDAIREHLDLKRQTGVDPVDLAREEREALGPAVREPITEGGPDGPAAPATETDVPAAAAPPVASSEAPGAYAAGSAPEESSPPDASTEVAPSPAVEAVPPDPATTPSAGETVSFEAEDLWADDDVPARAAETAEGPPPAQGEGEPASVDDVLEETPEFLQETPDHDRLWFEQKPPRDFDFDG